MFTLAKWKVRCFEILSGSSVPMDLNIWSDKCKYLSALNLRSIGAITALILRIVNLPTWLSIVFLSLSVKSSTWVGNTLVCISCIEITILFSYFSYLFCCFTACYRCIIVLELESCFALISTSSYPVTSYCVSFANMRVTLVHVSMMTFVWNICMVFLMWLAFDLISNCSRLVASQIHHCFGTIPTSYLYSPAYCLRI